MSKGLPQKYRGGAVLLDKEIVEMVVVLILMSSAHFTDVADYVANTEMQPGEHNFMEFAVKIAERKRQELSKGGAHEYIR